MRMRRDEKPVTQAELGKFLHSQFGQLYRRLGEKLDRFFKGTSGTLKRMEAKIDKTNHGVLATEKAILDKLKEHEERLGMLEDLHPPVN